MPQRKVKKSKKHPFQIMVFLPRIHRPVYVLENDGPTLLFWPFFLNFSLETARPDIPLCGVDRALKSGICLDFEKQDVCQTVKWKYRQIALEKCEKMTKNHSKAVYVDSIFALTFWSRKIGQYKIWCRIERATKWEKKIFGRPCLNVPKSENTSFCTWWKTRVTYSFSNFLH